MGMILRDYQQSCVDAIWRELRAGADSALAEVPTGGGKSLILAEICRQVVQEWEGRALVVTFVRELIEQLEQTMQRHAPTVQTGVYAAGLKRKEVAAVTLAQIHSCYDKALSMGAPNVLIVDEVHAIPGQGDGMYMTLLRELRIANPKMKLIGLTATPYRLGSGLICGDDKMFKAICYSADLLKLIEQGYLSKLVTKNAGNPDLSGVHTRAGDYVESELAEVMEDQAKVDSAVAEIVERGQDRKAWLLFACSVKHAAMLADALSAKGIACPTVTGETPSDERDAIVRDYKAGRIRAIANVNVLSTGFDAPHVDLVALLRPTQSAGLYYQQVGRGLRKSEGKTDCLVLDFSGNAERHGPLNMLTERMRGMVKGKGGGEAPSKTCPECSEVLATALRACPVCGHEFPPIATARHAHTASDLPIIASELPSVWKQVTGIECRPWTKRGAAPDAPRTMRVDYKHGLMVVASEWVCADHAPGSYARAKADAWLAEAGVVRGSANIEDLCCLVTRHPHAVQIRMGGDFPEIKARQWKAISEEEQAALVARAQAAASAEEPPF